MRMLADSNGLDAASYFYVGETLFLVVAVGVGFILGLWAGSIIWGRYKRKFQKSLDQIETHKEEIAQFRRRMAERAPKAAPQAAVFIPPAPTPAPTPVSVSPLAALVRGNLKPQEMPMAPRAFPSSPPARGFTVWTEEGWQAPHVILPPRSPGAAFTLWTQKGPPEDHEEAKAGTTTLTSSQAPDSGWLYTYEHSDHHAVRLPRSHAHTLWTERHWTPHPVTQPPAPPAVAFSLWTLPDFVPAMRGFQLPASLPRCGPSPIGRRRNSTERLHARRVVFRCGRMTTLSPQVAGQCNPPKPGACGQRPTGSLRWKHNHLSRYRQPSVCDGAVPPRRQRRKSTHARTRSPQDPGLGFCQGSRRSPCGF